MILCNPMDCSLSGSSIHGIFQARVLEWIAISFSKKMAIGTYISIITLNINGLNALTKRHRLASIQPVCVFWLEHLIHLCCLQASLVAQRLKHLLPMRETQVRSLDQEDPWRRKWQSTPALLPGKSHGRRRLIGYSPRGHRVGYD